MMVAGEGRILIIYCSLMDIYWMRYDDTTMMMLIKKNYIK